MSNLNFREFNLCNFDFKRRKCPSARCTSAANTKDSDTDIFNGSTISVNDWLVIKKS